MRRHKSIAIKDVILQQMQSPGNDVLYKPDKKKNVQLKLANQRLGEARTRESDTLGGKEV